MTKDEDEGMLLVLNDVQAEHEEELNLWYDTEHMQERMEIPGFLDVRRYQVLSGLRKYCTLYRTRNLAVFESEAYRQRLASQTEWSKRMLKVFVEPNRLVGEIRERLGQGSGGQLCIFQLSRASHSAVGSLQEHAAISEIARTRGVVAVRLFEATPRLSGPVKEYPPILQPLLKADDRLVLVETNSASPPDYEKVKIICDRAGVHALKLGTYSFSWGMMSSAA